MVNEAKKNPLFISYLQIRRFLMQISFDNVALTGSKMFKVTRGLILKVCFIRIENMNAKILCVIVGCRSYCHLRTGFNSV